MKISICIPQYNRIAFLIKNLEVIALQSYPDIEVVVSDDGSTDDTELQIKELQKHYKYPLTYYKSPKNIGYDRNLRQSMELATGDYCLVLGNDDCLHKPDDIQYLVDFLLQKASPDLGYCNYAEEADPSKLYERAVATDVLGSGYELALNQCSNFSFVAGLIFKKSAFNSFNTDKFDGSIYTQMYLASLMIASGCTVFSIQRALVLKDISVGNDVRDSYRDKIAKKWKDMKVVDGGLPSVINVLMSAFEDAEVITQNIRYRIFFRIYSTTYPHWLLDYRSNGALPEAVGMMKGLKPSRNKHFSKLNFFNRFRIWILYILTTIAGLLIPVFLFTRLKPALYKWLRKSVRQ